MALKFRDASLADVAVIAGLQNAGAGALTARFGPGHWSSLVNERGLTVLRLAGLWLGDRAEFDRAVRELRAGGGRVRTMRGCILAEESVASLVAGIEKGTWSREFIMGRLSSE